MHFQELLGLYKMTAMPRGLALIVEIANIRGLTPRHGSEVKCAVDVGGVWGMGGGVGAALSIDVNLSSSMTWRT